MLAFEFKTCQTSYVLGKTIRFKHKYAKTLYFIFINNEMWDVWTFPKISYVRNLLHFSLCCITNHTSCDMGSICGLPSCANRSTKEWFLLVFFVFLHWVCIRLLRQTGSNSSNLILQKRKLIQMFVLDLFNYRLVAMKTLNKSYKPSITQHFGSDCSE